MNRTAQSQIEHNRSLFYLLSTILSPPHQPFHKEHYKAVLIAYNRRVQGTAVVEAISAGGLVRVLRKREKRTLQRKVSDGSG